jgi:hypothetical protein
VLKRPDFDEVFPFGHGLSYTSFEFSDLSLSPTAPTSGSFDLSFVVTNTGSRPGEEVAQVYVRDRVASIARPVRQLVAHARVSLEPGQAATVRCNVPVSLLSFTAPDLRRVVEPGDVEVFVGSSSAATPLRGVVALTGPTLAMGEDRALTSTVTVT